MTTAVILAGGLGTRLRSAVPDLPKPMAPINGRPFLEHQMAFWRAQGVSRFVLSVGYRREVVIRHFGEAFEGAPVRYAEETTPLGTGGGMLLAAQGLTEDFLVLNGDTFFDVDLAALQRFHQDKEADWTIALFRADQAGRYMGVDLAEDDRIRSLRSGAGAPGRLANGGVYMIRPQALAALGFAAGERLSLEDDILPKLQAGRDRVFGLAFPGAFIDIGAPDDYHRAAGVLPT